MGIEIERKYLVTGDAWRQRVTRQQTLRQGYFNRPVESGDHASVRVRVAGDAAYLNIKSAEAGEQRIEFDYEVPVPDAIEMLDALCRRPLIEKTRHWVEQNELVFEIDVFHGENSGLIIAELELESSGQAVTLPEWVGREVTEHYRYYNTALCERPYSHWSGDERNP